MTIDELIERAKQQDGLNVDLLRATAALLREEPERYCQWDYVSTPPDLEPGCGTVACIAGHALLAAGLPLVSLARMERNGWSRIPDAAQGLLGLTEDQADTLFDAECIDWPMEYKARYRATKNWIQRAEVAASLLEAIADGTVEL